MAVSQYLGKLMALTQGEPPPQQVAVTQNLTMAANQVEYSQAGQAPPGAKSPAAGSWMTPMSWMQLMGLLVGLTVIVAIGSMFLGWKRAERYE
jgi:acyl-CoA synthetase (AMP-forming)/AMP-acid ligase II